MTHFLSFSNLPATRRRLRRPLKSSSSSSVERVSSLSKDQEISSSITKFRRTRPSHRKSSENSLTSETKKDKDGYKIVCYYTNWSQYRVKIGKFTPEDIIPDLCTHIIFAFGWLKKGKLSSFETNDETKDGKVGLYDRINKLKKANPNLKTLLAIGKKIFLQKFCCFNNCFLLVILGGWSFGTQKFKEMAATRYARQTFIFSAIPYLRQRNFDGLDIDWEYPAGSEDKKNYVLLLKGK